MLKTQEYEKQEAQNLPVDVLILCTGWSPISSLYSPRLADEMGLPVNYHGKIGGYRKVNDENCAHTPDFSNDYLSLQKPPKYREAKQMHTPFSLYKAMVPEIDSDNHSIIFLGKLVLGNNFRAAEVQALWAVAYLDGHIQTDKARLRQNISETVSWCRMRYLNKGGLGSWFFFDVVDYTDMLLAQLGLKSHRQKGWFKDFFGPCMARDLTSLIDEYKNRYP